MKGRVGGDRTTNVVLRPGYFFLALFHRKDGLLQLRFEFRDFENGQGLSLMNDVSDIDVDLLHIAANLGVHIDHLVRLELAGQS